VGVGVWIVDGAVHIYVRYVLNLVVAGTISFVLVAELVSAYPTAGGMYFVTKNVVPPKHSALWSWVIGWCNFLGQTAGVASVAYTVSQQILAAVSMNSHFNGEAYAFSP
jgi:amino acid transporter